MGIFDQIKSAFAKAEPAPATRQDTPAKAVEPASPTPEAAPPKAETRSYTVQSGDTLWKIAEDQYGDGNAFQKIFEANRDLLESPDHILPGQELVIP